MGRKRRIHRRHRSGQTSKSKQKTVRVTYANGRVEHHPDDGRTYPAGTMLSWDAPGPSGKPEMRWTVVGGWPFDD